MIEKPKIGQPCNGCGICCQIQLCNTGAFLLRKIKYLGEKTIKGTCPALIGNADKTYSCGLIVSPHKFIRYKYRPEVISRTVAKLVGAGNGCDEMGYSEDPDEEEALYDLVQKLKNDSQWRNEMEKNVELLMKF